MKTMIRDSALAVTVMTMMVSAGAAAHAEENGTGGSSAAASGNTAAAGTADAAASDAAWLTAEEEFTERDLEQSADAADAVSLTLQDGEDLTISEAGVYVITGEAEDASVIVDAADEDKVQLVLDGITVTNQDFPCIYVRSADKVFVTTTDAESVLSVTGAFISDGDTNTDAVIFSKDDLVLNGTGSLTVVSSDNGISCKDTLKITGGTLTVTAGADGLEANDAIEAAGGAISVTAGKDGLQAGDDDIPDAGTIYIADGTLEITAADDAMQGAAIVQIDSGSLTLEGRECIEGTWVRINGGTININASDDAINAAAKTEIGTPKLEIAGGSITIVTAAGDTDAIDVNGDLSITGGTIDITAQSPFDVDGQIEFSGGTLIVNGEETTEIANQMMGGRGGMQGFGGQNGMMPQDGAEGQNGMMPQGGTEGQNGMMPQDGFGRHGMGPRGGSEGESGMGPRNGFGGLDQMEAAESAAGETAAG